MKENNAIIIEFVGLRAKMYALRIDGEKDIKKKKGVKSNVIARSIMFNDYTLCLNDTIEMTRKHKTHKFMHKIEIARSIHHIQNENRFEFIRIYDKRYIVPDSTDTLP